ncbi:hypothetical protein ABW19_dt0201847 [Dactylella cylindrospora]|nr:hypothetical protein ABW19_dt0201847 [Dactylella cylindrospora]
MASSISICRTCLTRPSSTFLRHTASHLTRRTVQPSLISTLLPAASKNFSKPFSTNPTPQAAAKSSSKSKSGKAVKKKKPKSHFKIWNHADVEKWALMDAIRYIKAFEVGNNPRQMKYDLAVKLATVKNGPTVKNRIRLPKAVKTDLRICVFAEGSQAEAARAAGAAIVGTTEIWEQIKKGEINFDRCICHSSVLADFQKQNLGKILGPKGLMPSPKTGTVVGNVAEAVTTMVGASEYRERMGVVRMAVGQLAFTPEEVRDNIRAFMEQLRKDLRKIEDFDKRINEVVLSSTNSPGFSLSGEFRSDIGKTEYAAADESSEVEEEGEVEGAQLAVA